MTGAVSHAGPGDQNPDHRGYLEGNGGGWSAWSRIGRAPSGWPRRRSSLRWTVPAARPDLVGFVASAAKRMGIPLGRQARITHSIEPPASRGSATTASRRPSRTAGPPSRALTGPTPRSSGLRRGRQRRARASSRARPQPPACLAPEAPWRRRTCVAVAPIRALMKTASRISRGGGRCARSGGPGRAAHARVRRRQGPRPTPVRPPHPPARPPRPDGGPAG